jgi:hypothetical protein
METLNAPRRATANLSDLEITYILSTSDAGSTKSAILAQTSLSHFAIMDSIKKYDIKIFTGVAPSTGNPKVLSEHEVRTLICITKKIRRKTLEDIPNILPTKHSKWTLQRQLSAQGIKNHITLKKPLLTNEHKCQ